MHRPSRPILLLVAASLVLAAFAWLVWPTPYHYHPYLGTMVRVSRLTGRAEALSGTGWRALTAPPKQRPEEADLSVERYRTDSATNARIQARIEARARKP